MSTVSPVEAPARSQAPDRDADSLRRRWELTFTAITLACIFLSLGAERLELATPLILLFNVSAYAAGGWFGLLDTLGDLRNRKLGVDFLMIIAAVGAASIDQWHEGATLLFLFSLSNTLQTYAMGRSRRAIEGLLKLRPKDANVLRDGKEQKVPLESVQVGDVVVVRPGEMTPTDGKIRAGLSDINEASITGESKPIDKGPGDKVFAGTLNGAGSLEIETQRAPEDSTLARIVKLVESAQGEKARTQRFLDDVEGYYAWTVAVGTVFFILVPWLVFSADFTTTFYRAMVLLVVASPCALVISTPAAILSAIAAAARNGVLFKGGIHLENLAEIKVVAFDKTGTLTTGVPKLTDIVVNTDLAESPAEDTLLAWAAAMESKSEHSIAKAIVRAAEERGLVLPEVHKFISLPGRGVQVTLDNFLVWIGGERLFEEHGERIPAHLLETKQRLEKEGKSVLVLHRELGRTGNIGQHEEDGGWLGLVAVADTMRPQAPEAIAALKRLGIVRTVMLTGDNPSVAETVAKAAGVDEFHAALLPEEKVEMLHRLQKNLGNVLMVGDGVNDAPALAHAAVGMAMGGAGTDVTLESADVVLMGDDLRKIAFAVRLSRRANTIVRMNVAFSLAVIAFLVAGTFLFTLPMPLGVIGHEGSTLIVVANGLRMLAMRDR
ncbi:MAG: cadmium-translocating P-type ATPase [Candidatus Hydrogenedentes bacterium]|nr:cadmium-translocating P-type ATPase [Candidatus Hydrogenedentota bacterium]